MFKTKHNHASGIAKKESPTYKAWAGMKQRCTNSKAPNYSRYGGRGISYDPRWESFSNFLEDMGVRPKGRSLDRIDNNGNYCKDNCRWATAKQQANNRKHPVTKYSITLNGETKALSLWCAEFGVNYHTALWRMHRGWNVDELFGEAYVSYNRRM